MANDSSQHGAVEEVPNRFPELVGAPWWANLLSKLPLLPRPSQSHFSQFLCSLGKRCLSTRQAPKGPSGPGSACSTGHHAPSSSAKTLPSPSTRLEGAVTRSPGSLAPNPKSPLLAAHAACHGHMGGAEAWPQGCLQCNPSRWSSYLFSARIYAVCYATSSSSLSSPRRPRPPSFLFSPSLSLVLFPLC